MNEHHGYTFVIVTHDMNLAAQLADRIIILDKGRIVADGTARKILTDEKLLDRSRLEPPILTRMFQRLLDDPLEADRIPLTVDEALSFLREYANKPAEKECVQSDPPAEERTSDNGNLYARQA